SRCAGRAPRARGRARGRPGGPRDVVERQGRYGNMEIEPVEQRARQPAQVPPDLARRTATGEPRLTAPAAQAGAERPDQLEARRHPAHPPVPGDRHEAFLERLAQGLEAPAPELGEL